MHRCILLTKVHCYKQRLTVQIILITGTSGAGKSIVLNILEDRGYYCVDNLPARLLVELSHTLAEENQTHLAVAIDARNATSITELPAFITQLRKQHEVRLLFLNADTDTLVQRFSETRRRHPLAAKFPAQFSSSNSPSPNHLATLVEAIELERTLLAPLAEFGHTIDTSKLHPHTLRNWVSAFVQHPGSGLTLLFESFGFKYGVPRDADFVFDVRSLPNPHYDPVLRPLTGCDLPVQEFLLAQPIVLAMADDIRQFIEKWLSSFSEDSRSYLTVAIGCTGGQHRSVFLTERLAQYFAANNKVLIRHREIASLPNRGK